LLFRRKGSNYTTILKSLSEIFDILVGRQVILIQGSPGSGKTTLANENLPSVGRRYAYSKLYTCYYKLRDPRIVSMGSIDELIYCSTSYASFMYETFRLP